jgi:hypothetical protein
MRRRRSRGLPGLADRRRTARETLELAEEGQRPTHLHRCRVVHLVGDGVYGACRVALAVTVHQSVGAGRRRTHRGQRSDLRSIPEWVASSMTWVGLGLILVLRAPSKTTWPYPGGLPRCRSLGRHSRNHRRDAGAAVGSRAYPVPSPRPMVVTGSR